jgi:Tripartite tricarboxylate transporter TctB family
MAQKAQENSGTDKKLVLSEEANAGFATPIMDMLAAAIVAATALAMAVESLLLPVPGGIMTAPGLLPFLTSASLLIMAVILGVNALGRRRATPRELDRVELPSDFKRSLALGGIVILYVSALQFVPVRTSFYIGSLHFVIGAFETVSVVVITGLLRFYWGARLWACLTVAVFWIAFLSVTFRMVFQTPLP